MNKSLEEINGTVSFDDQASWMKKILMYIGPGMMVAVGYMDPGNWITSMSGGATYGYVLLSVILISSLAAMLLQSMSARLGIASGMDLAQATRQMTGRRLGAAAWLITELAIMATDIAEIIGSAIAMNLLFDLPLSIGVAITVLDVFLLLTVMRFGFRKIEAIVGVLIFTVLFIFVYEVAVAGPEPVQILKGFIPHHEIVTNKGALYLALGIIGATIMPHNLYLHSSIVQSRDFKRNDEGRRQAIRYATIDSNIQLTLAFVVNCLLLILGAALFFGSHQELGRFYELYDALKHSTIGGAAGSAVMATLFAVALLASGQNSTITGTLSGQIIMEGYLHLKIPQWIRRLVTRLIAVVPVFICLIIYGSDPTKVEDMLIFTQVFLSVALPFSIVPLLIATNKKEIMGVFTNPRWVNVTGWIVTVILILLNVYLIIATLQEI